MEKEREFPKYVPPSKWRLRWEALRDFPRLLWMAISSPIKYYLDPRPKLDLRKHPFSRLICSISDSFSCLEYSMDGFLTLEGQFVEPEIVRGEKVSLSLSREGRGLPNGWAHFNSMLDPENPIRGHVIMPLDEATLSYICKHLKEDGLSPYHRDFIKGVRTSDPSPHVQTIRLVFDVIHPGLRWPLPELACWIKGLAIDDPKRREAFSPEELQ